MEAEKSKLTWELTSNITIDLRKNAFLSFFPSNFWNNGNGNWRQLFTDASVLLISDIFYLSIFLINTWALYNITQGKKNVSHFSPSPLSGNFAGRKIPFGWKTLENNDEWTKTDLFRHGSTLKRLPRGFVIRFFVQSFLENLSKRISM